MHAGGRDGAPDEQGPSTMLRRTFLTAAGLLAAASSTRRTWAADAPPFTAQAFADAQAAGRPILVEIHAPWCPTCRAQEPILAGLVAKPAYAGLVLLRVDFDTQKDIVRRFRATSQSTLIAFKGSAETARSVGDTDPARIEKLVASAF